MDHKHFQSAKRPFSVIFNCKPTNQVIRYKHEGQVSAKIMLEQKADFLKFDSNESTLVVEQQYKNVNEINRLNTLVTGADLDRCNRSICYGQIFLTKYWLFK